MKRMTTLGVTVFTIGALLAPMTAEAASQPKEIVLHTSTGKSILGIGIVVGSGCELPDLPCITLPGFTFPDCNLPGFGTPDNCLPDNTPDYEAPGTDAPDGSLPDSDDPGTDIPDIEVPDADTPGTESPGESAPDAEVPDADTPGTESPGESAPDTEVPDADTPGAESPDVNVPDMDIPGGSLPGGNLPDSGQPDLEKPDTDSPSSPSYSYLTQVVNLVNIERAKHGLSPLAIDTGLEKAALVRAREIQVSFSHTRPNGTSFATAIKEAGVSYRRCGENIAWGQKSPEAVVTAWMNSSGHRANILSPDFTRIGIGYRTNASGTPYWVQLFAS